MKKKQGENLEFCARNFQKTGKENLKNPGFKKLAKSGEKKSELIFKILTLRNSYDEAVHKLRKGFFQKERAARGTINKIEGKKTLNFSRPKSLELKKPENEKIKKFEEKSFKEKLKFEYDEKIEKLKKDLDSSVSLKVEKTSNEIQRFWKGTLEKLEISLEQKIEKNHEIRVQGTNKKNSEKISQEKTEKFIKEIEAEQKTRIQEEKQKWVEIFKKEYLLKLSKEGDEILLEKQEKILKQAEREKQEILKNIKKDTEELLVATCQNNLARFDQDFFKNLTCSELKNSLKKDLKKLITAELKKKIEQSIFTELNSEHEATHNIFRKQLEKDEEENLKKIQTRTENSKILELENQVDKKLSKIEKELKVKYLRKSEKLLIDLQKEFEGIYLGQIKNIRDKLVEEKAETARIKSELNVYINRKSNEKACEMKSLQDQEDLLNRTIKSINTKQQLEKTQSLFKSRSTSKSPLRKSEICSSLESQVKAFPKSFLPSSLACFSEDTKKKSSSSERKILKAYDSTEIAESLIQKNSENSRKYFFNRRASKEENIKKAFASEDRQTVLEKEIKDIEGRNTYAELLNKKFGVIEPRLK